MIQWTAPNQNDSVYFGDNAFNNGKFGYNNLQQVVGTWTHKFNEQDLHRYRSLVHVHERCQVASDAGGPVPERILSRA